MKIGIIGTRGIPNRYGGFEQLAELLSVGLYQCGHAVTVYNSHRHPYQQKKFDGVDMVHCYDPEHRLGTAGQFIYDLNCVRDARRRNFDVLLFLGYTSSSVWGRLYPKKPVIISNMDGLEWKRKKYAKPVRHFLRYAELLAVKHSDHFIADSVAIQSYLKKKFGICSEYIAYGTTTDIAVKEELLAAFNITRGNYFMLMARMEPENNIEMILEGFHNSNSHKKFIVVGNTHQSYGKQVVKKFGRDERIIFAGAIFDAVTTHTLQALCSLYFHGHSVGGTNPSLLDAMGAGGVIAAHDNAFNRAVLEDDGFYFTSSSGIQQLIELPANNEQRTAMSEKNNRKIKDQYNWPSIINHYEEFITLCYNQPGR